jgi:hypothetical protein
VKKGKMMGMNKQTNTIQMALLLVSLLLIFGLGESASAKTVGQTLAEDSICSAENQIEPPVTECTALFDRDRYIDIDEIQPGMRGYGLTVFFGTEPDKFEVEVVSVMRNIEPKRNAILIRCHDERFDLAKGVQGVSGSPVFFQGRMAGAMAFGWAYGEEPLYGVTPIKEMLDIQSAGKGSASSGENMSGGVVTFDRTIYKDLMAEVLLDQEDLNRMARQAGLAGRSESAGASMGLTALPMPIMVGGSSSRALCVMQEQIPSLSLLTGVPSSGGETGKEVTLQPGSTVTIPLIMGDMNGAVLGTVTEVVDGKVYGFGHAWNGTGSSLWPMASGYIHTFVNRSNMSFKLGDATQIIGAIQADEAAGIFGRVGADIQTIPIHVSVHWAATEQRENFEVRIAQDNQADPVLATLVAINSVLQKGDLPREHTLTYKLKMEFDRTEPFVFENISSDNHVQDIVSDMLNPLGLLLNNPWNKVKLTQLEMEATVYDRISQGAIRSAQLSQLMYRPGQSVQARIIVEPVRGELVEYAPDVKLPDDLPDGMYQVVIGSDQSHQQQLRAAQPQRYMAFNAEDVQRILQERLSIRRDKLYMSIILPDSGIAIENTSLPSLPESKAMVLMDKSRFALTRRFQALASDSVDTNYVISGNLNFIIQVQKQ